MLPYIFSYIFILTLSPLIIKTQKKINFLFFIALFPACFFSIFRGDIGTDTPTYKNIASIIISSSNELEEINIEPIFYLLIKILGLLGLGANEIILSIAIIYCLLFFSAFEKNKENIIVALFLIFPLFFFDSAMNGIRYGIAFCLAKIAADSLQTRKFHKAFIFTLLSIGFHASSLIILIIYAIRKTNIKTIFILFFISAIFIYINNDYIVAKLTLYSDYAAPNSTSGLSLFFISFLLLLHSLILCKKSPFFSTGYIIFLFLISIFLFYFTSYTYAALRLSQLLIFSNIIYMIDLYKSSKNKNIQAISFLLIGIICFYFKFRNFYSIDSGFYPYHFFWEII